MAHANDGGGSIRIPAACCGLFGLKPTRARNPMGPDMGDMLSGYICEHAVTRSVRDSAALLDATSGPDIGDPYWAPPPERPFIEEVGADPGKLKIAFTTDPGTDAKVHEDCKQAVREAAELCAELGHEVTEASPPINGDLMVELFIPVWSAGAAWSIEALAMMTGKTPSRDQFEPLTWALYEAGSQQKASQYLLAITMFQQMSRAIAGFFTGYDVLLTPSATEPPPPLGTFDAPPDDPMQAMARAGDYVPFTPICNFTGQPAMSMPLMWNADGLPVGTHFMGRFGDEATLFRLAAQLELARPWAGKRPPVSA
jgi:amidase